MTENIEKLDSVDNHFIHRSNWLRAAVLGANDGILSTASLAIGIAAASGVRNPIVLTHLECYLYGFEIVFLIFLGALSAKIGGSSII